MRQLRRTLASVRTALVRGIHPAHFGLIQDLNDYAQFADYVVFSGLAAMGKHPEVIVDLAHEQPAPLRHIFTEQFEQQGYVYARVDLNPPP